MRRGITLIELLVTITIIAIISAAILGTASAAMEAARDSRTRSLIKRINQVVLEKYDAYQTQRVPIHRDFDVAIEYSFSGSERGMAKQDIRLIALREKMKMEMPDRWADVENDPLILATRPSSTIVYLRKRQSLTADPDKILQYQGAECLYLTVMNGPGDDEVAMIFGESDIGDVDGDGAKEFVDGWGKPISWLRWPWAFDKGNAMTRDTFTDRDPFDIFNRDADGSIGPTTPYRFPAGHTATRDVPGILNGSASPLPGLRDSQGAFRLIPLVYSAGPDDEYDINSIIDATPSLNPYDPDLEFGAAWDINEDGVENWRDNIHNQND